MDAAKMPSNRLPVSEPVCSAPCGGIWATAQGQGSVLDAAWPEAQDAYLVEDQTTYPISFNGKVRFKMDLAASMSPADVEAAVKADERTSKPNWTARRFKKSSWSPAAS